MVTEKHAGGRPTKYKPEFCKEVVELMKQGYSIEEVCYDLDISKQTFYDWCDRYPEFLDSKKRGVDCSRGWWMKNGRVNLKDKDFSSTLWYMNMKNRFGWRDKQDISGETKQTVVNISGDDAEI